MRILLFGKNGQVGWELNRSLLPLGEIFAFGREQVDFSNPESLRVIVREVNPDVIVNAVAYTAVDQAEEQEELAAKINGMAPGVLADEASNINALLVHYSTDYVFDGAKNSPYVETDKPNPVNTYGRTKLAGEQSIQLSGCPYLIFRTSWVYASRGHNFLLTILKLAKEREEISIVSDQIGSPTSARLIAETTSQCVHQASKEIRTKTFSSDLYHLTTSDWTSWHGFAEKVVSYINMEPRFDLKIRDIQAILTENYPAKAQRPMNSRFNLDKIEKTFDVKMPGWEQTLKLCLEEYL